MDSEDTLATLKAEVARLSTRLAQLEAGFSEQEAGSDAAQAHEAAVSAQPLAEMRTGKRATRTPKRGKVGRRGLLLGAAGVTAAAVATAATVAVSDPQAAFAAAMEPATNGKANLPNTTGGTFILGAANDADQMTMLSNTGTTATDLLGVNLYAPSASNLTTISASAIVAPGALAPKPNRAIPGSGSGGPGFSVVVEAYSDNGIGVMGWSQNFIDLASYGSGRIWQTLQFQAGPPSGTGFFPGESIRDINGDLWLCVSIDGSGNPVWRKVALLAPGANGGATSYLSKPIRLLDTRVGLTDANQHPGTPCKSSAPTTVNVAGVTYNSVTVYAGAVGAIGNVTVLNAAGGGFLEIVPSGAGFTGAANLAFGPGQIISNAFNAGLSSGNLDIIIGGANVDVIIDLFAIVA